ncbi:MAG TPA: hypothetical protein VFS12_09510 [Terriglobia bacterium]|nr:hypothetical protein [Terriglobia bacterium]
MNHREGASSLIDVSFLLEAPAGKGGFIRVQDSHFVKPDGKRIRFWGVNLTDWSKGSVMIPPKEDAPMWAATLSRFGVNCVRLHFLDLAAPRGLIDKTREDSREFDAEQLDRLDFFIAELKKRGIYINLNLNVGRSYKAGDGVQDYDKIRWAKGLTLFDPRLIELQKEYARKLLTHSNPYTKAEYRHEPAVAIVELVNENALYAGFRSPTPYYDNALNEIYNTWLQKKLTPDELDKLRAIAGVAADEPLPRLKGGAEVAAAPKDRFHTELSFYMELEKNYFRDMQAYLTDTLGVKSPIVGTADHSHSGSSYPLLASTSLLDVVDGHTYWQHPSPRGIPNTPMVNDPFNSTVVELSRTAFAGKPYTVSEVNHPYPNEWASEGIPILAAYAAFQDWDAIFWYTFEPKLAPDWKPYVGDPFDISLHPVKMPQLAAGALMFLRGDVSSARKTVERSYSREQVLDSVRLAKSERPYFTPGFPLSIPLRHGSRIRSLDGKPTTGFQALNLDSITSDTGELVWDLSADKRGVVTLETDRSQALIGHVNEARKNLRNLTAQISNTFCSIALSSLDSKPISRSERMLLITGAGVANTGTKWNESRTALADWGGPPTLIEPVKGKVILRNLEKAAEVRATALDGAGKRIGKPLAAKQVKDGWEIEIGDPSTTWYEVTVRKLDLRAGPHTSTHAP